LIESEERLSSAEVSMPASDAFHETARASLLGASGGDVESETTSSLTLKEASCSQSQNFLSLEVPVHSICIGDKEQRIEKLDLS